MTTIEAVEWAGSVPFRSSEPSNSLKVPCTLVTIAWRTENGGFTSVTELLEVDGIGDATLADLTPYVTV